MAWPFAPIRAVVRDRTSPNNAYYKPSTGELLFGDFGGGRRPTARSAEIIYHELGHAVADAVCHLSRSMEPDTQSRGMGEGYSDYFAASALDDPRLGDYVLDGGAGQRDCSRPSLRFPPAFRGEEHETGEVWASVLWALRARYGGDVADRIALESLYFLDEHSSFEDGRAALQAADRMLFPDADGGAHERAIEEEFAARRPAS